MPFIYIGLKFWKVGSRKIFAVKQEPGGKAPHRDKHITISDSESDDDLEPLRKKSKLSCNISALVTDVKEIRNDLQSLFRITNQMKIPVALDRQLRDTFLCQICRSTPITPPVIFARCCKRILGCQPCVDTWYGGETGMARKCPICRSERAYSETTVLRGLDDFLKAIAPILQAGGTEAGSSENDDDQ